MVLSFIHVGYAMFPELACVPGRLGLYLNVSKNILEYSRGNREDNPPERSDCENRVWVLGGMPL